MFVRGDQREIPVPDLSGTPMGEDIAPGEVFWLVYSISVPGLDFDEISYNQLNSGYWSARSTTSRSCSEGRALKVVLT